MPRRAETLCWPCSERRRLSTMTGGERRARSEMCDPTWCCWLALDGRGSNGWCISARLAGAQGHRACKPLLRCVIAVFSIARPPKQLGTACQRASAWPRPLVQRLASGVMSGKPGKLVSDYGQGCGCTRRLVAVRPGPQCAAGRAWPVAVAEQGQQPLRVRLDLRRQLQLCLRCSAALAAHRRPCAPLSSLAVQRAAACAAAAASGSASSPAAAAAGRTASSTSTGRALADGRRWRVQKRRGGCTQHAAAAAPGALCWPQHASPGAAGRQAGSFLPCRLAGHAVARHSRPGGPR